MRPFKGDPIRGRPSHLAGEEGAVGHVDALQSMLTGEYTEESTGARTIRQTGGKDRHSKVFTSRGPRDRRVRLSVATAIRFYDLQDRLGFEQPSKAVEWLLLNCQPSIKALPQLGTLHQSQARPVVAIPANDHSPSQIQAMDLKSSNENTTHHNTLYSHRFNGQGNHRAQLALLQHNQRYLHKDANFVHTHPLYHPIEEDPPQSSNPSSSGGSSDHPTSLSEASQEQRFKSETAISTGAPELSQHSNLTSASFPCINKRRRVQRPPCLNQVDHQPPSDEYASFRSEANALASTGIMSNDQQCPDRLTVSQSLLGRNNMGLASYDPCSLISSNTGRVYGAGTYSQLISTNMNMGTNPLLSTKQSKLLMDSSMHGTQMDVAMQPTVRTLEESSNYASIAQLQQLQTSADHDLANDTLMSFQTVEGDSLSRMHSQLDDTMHLYGICSTMDVSPSESNNINMVAAAVAAGDYVDGKGAISDTRVNHNEVEEYRPSFNEWALRHALL